MKTYSKENNGHRLSKDTKDELGEPYEDSYYHTKLSSSNQVGYKKKSPKCIVQSSDHEGYIKKTIDSQFYHTTKTNSIFNSEKRFNEPDIGEHQDFYDDIEDGKPATENMRGISRKMISKEDSTIEASDRGYQADMDPKGHTDDVDNNFNSYRYSYSVSIQRKGAHYAGGALVRERWVLSTAEEFYNVRETIKLFRIRLGSSNCKKGGVTTPIISITIHPDFTRGRPSYDISLQKIAVREEMKRLDSITPIPISKVQGKVVEAQFLATYWPRIVIKQGVVSPTALERVKFSSMRVSTQKLIPSEECRRQLGVNFTLDENSLCLNPVKRHHSACMPDVGAPIVAADGLWGITSGWVPAQCSARAPPTVFTRVSTFHLRAWIEDCTSQK